MPEMETLMDNFFSIQLCDTDAQPHYVSNPQELKSRLPVLIVMNQSERRLAAEFPRFNYQDVIKTAVREPNDPPHLMTYNPGFLQAGGAFDNASKFKVTLMDVDPNDHSKLQVNLIPFLEGEY
jgi:hypothetical protein